MAGRTPARRPFGGFQSDKLPASPCGATPRPHLRQQYPKTPDIDVTTYQRTSKRTVEGDYNQVKRSTTDSYTVLRSKHDGLDTMDAAEVEEYSPIHAGSGSYSKAIIVLGLIFFISLVAVGLVYARFRKSGE